LKFQLIIGFKGNQKLKEKANPADGSNLARKPAAREPRGLARLGLT
jgi:hypothetical protein